MKYFEPHLSLDEISESSPGHSFLPKKIGPYTLSILFLLLFLNSIILDAYFFLNATKKQTVTLSTQQAEIPKSIQNQVATQAVPDICPNACTNQIDTLKSAVNTIKQSPIVEAQTSSSSKEFFIPFGSGQSTATDWTDVPGLVSYIDSSAYGKIKSVTFEPSVYIPTGNETVWVRLYNLTDSHPVWFSEVSISGGTAQQLLSGPITLDQGIKRYSVQMKTQLAFIATLSQARVHITTN